MRNEVHDPRSILVLGGTGKTGRRVAERLRAQGHNVRVGSRSAARRFDWELKSTWPAVLEGIDAVYVSYYPDLAVPGAVDATRAFAELAVQSGARRLTLLSGRGEREAEHAEEAVRDTGAELTVLRASWFMQNFSEDYMRDHVLSGEIRLPAANTPIPFLDVDDLAEVAAASLTDDRYAGQVFELTGPHPLTFADAAAQIADASGRELRYTPVSLVQHERELAGHGVAPEVVGLLTYLFSEVVNEENARTADGVERAIGRQPREFADYARRTAAAGAWHTR